MVKATREPASGRILIEVKNGPDVGFVHVMPATARQILLALDECLNVPDSERAPVRVRQPLDLEGAGPTPPEFA